MEGDERKELRLPSLRPHHEKGKAELFAGIIQLSVFYTVFETGTLTLSIDTYLLKVHRLVASIVIRSDLNGQRPHGAGFFGFLKLI